MEDWLLEIFWTDLIALPFLLRDLHIVERVTFLETITLAQRLEMEVHMVKLAHSLR